MTVTFRRSMRDSYRVLLDGRDVGEVRKWSQSYNLRRPVTLRGWLAFDAAHAKVRAPGTQSGAWPTRGDAADALVTNLVTNDTAEAPPSAKS